MKDLAQQSAKVVHVTVTVASEGQRLDNFLAKTLKGAPKSLIYRIVRSGEVRVNGGRAQADTRLNLDDKVRVPPIRLGKAIGGQQPAGAQGDHNAGASGTMPPLRGQARAGPFEGDARKRPSNGRFQGISATVVFPVLFEDDELLAINKPAGVAVHGGSGVSLGVIEHLRQQRPGAPFLELVHRLDRDTSGVLLLAKKRSALVALHEAIRQGEIDKRYSVVVAGHWPHARAHHVKEALSKFLAREGERRVSVADAGEGQYAHTVFSAKQVGEHFSWLEAQLLTGRTHQIRVHLQSMRFPIVGDDKYGDFPLNKRMAKQGFKRMYLHAHRMRFSHPLTGERLSLEAPPDAAWGALVAQRLDSGGERD
jgi:23S rRNA pseudouridine955/2504/2580 synthase